MDFQQFQPKPGMTANHISQADGFIRFCDNYRLRFIDPSPSTLAYYITHPSSIFASPKSVRNYVSRAQFLHKQLALEAFDSFQVSSLLMAADPTMRTSSRTHLTADFQYCLSSSPSSVSSHSA